MKRIFLILLLVITAIGPALQGASSKQESMAVIIKRPPFNDEGPGGNGGGRRG